MHFRSGEHSECICSLNFEYWQFWKATLMVFTVLLFITSQESYSQSYFKYYICRRYVKKRVALVQGPFCLYRGGRSHRRGNLPFSSWPEMKAKCEYALINPNSHSKRPDCGGSRRINRNGFFPFLRRDHKCFQQQCATLWDALRPDFTLLSVSL